MENVPRLFGSNKPLGRVSGVVRGLDPKKDDYTQIDFYGMNKEHGRLTANLGIVTLKIEGVQLGFNRETLRKVGVAKIRSLQKSLPDLIRPTEEFLDPRNNQAKTIYAANSELNDLFGAEIVVKKSDFSGDGLSPEQQFEAGKVSQRAVDQAQLGKIVEVNKAFGYIQGNEVNYLFLEKVNGHNFQQMQNGQAESIPTQDLKKIFSFLKERLQDWKNEIIIAPDFLEAQKISSENSVQSFLRKANYYNQKTNFSSLEREKNREKYSRDFQRVVKSYKYYYSEALGTISRVESLIEKINTVDHFDNKEVCNLISDSLYFILSEKSTVSINFIGDINKSKSYGQDNLMYDLTKQKIVIIDPGPPVKR